MAGRAQVGFAAVALMLLPMTYAAGPGLAQPADPDAAPSRQAGVGHNYLQVPLGNIAPGATPAEPELENPMANDPASAQRGMQYFNGFNCVGCHAPNGGGGMGPSLTSRNFKFGNAPAQHFMVIAHGAPFGMPAWAGQLPENVIWDLASYIEGISNAPDEQWGTTISPGANLPRIQQVPAELNPTTKPWQATQPFPGGPPSPR